MSGLLGSGFYDLNQLRLGHQAKPLGAVAPMIVTGPLEAAGVHLPTAQFAGAHLFKGQEPADIQIGPAPAPKSSTRSKSTTMFRALRLAKP